MKKKYLFIFLTGFLTLGIAGVANATSINYTATDLADAGTGDLWEYSYTVSDTTFVSDTGFSIYFDLGLYQLLDPAPTAPNADWDVLSWDPDPGIPDAGAYDAYALTSGASLADAFTISFVWLGGGTGPGSQFFDVYDGFTFATLESGETVAGTVSVPAPATIFVFGIGLVGLLLVSSYTKRKQSFLFTLKEPHLFS